MTCRVSGIDLFVGSRMRAWLLKGVVEVLARVRSCALLGIDAYFVEVEVDVGRGLPSFSTVGLPDAAVRESRERVLSAIRNSALEIPPRRIVVNLAPADTRKEGAGFDLAVAIGLLCATGQLSPERLEGFVFVGELSLDGRLRGVRGVLSMAFLAKTAGVSGMIVPAENGCEAETALGEKVYTAGTLSEIVQFLRGERPLPSPVSQSESTDGDGKRRAAAPDFSEVKGQQQARRALEVAAAGNHNVIMVGPPGAGKTMLARRVPSILPTLSREEAVETTRIYSAAGRLPRGAALLSLRPFRSPHHTISAAGAIGGGKTPRPGEVSLAHNGVLFLDELPEFRRDVLEALRQPIEEGHLTISRAGGTVSFPARFMFIAASNPCQCGFFTDSVRQCNCTPTQIRGYMGRLSGPLLDRIDIHIAVPRITFREIAQTQECESSQRIRERVLGARSVQLERYAGLPGLRTNADLGESMIKRFCLVDESALELLKAAMERLGLTGRAFHRILKVARTIADLGGAELPRAEHVAEAIQYRTLDRVGFGWL
ncbi:MAG: YifB family Mg chelatase-like AAA ATPase [Candidatus Eisenbacteria bacterium]